MINTIVISLMLCTLTGCMTQPIKGVPPVQDFDLNRYLGVWHEVARLDHRFERDLTQVTAEYRLRDDGGVAVINQGFHTKKQAWQSIEGKAYLLGLPHVGSLKVSFFGPFYGGYHVIDLDTDYQFALVSGPNRDYLWLLSRQQSLSDAAKLRLLEKAQAYGFDIDALIWLSSKPNAPIAP